MSYNLMFNTTFSDIGTTKSLWRLKNCQYKDGYLVPENSCIYAISQEIILSDPTKVYASFDYIALDKNIKSITIGVLEKGILHSTRKKPCLNKRKRLSVVHETSCEKITVMLIVEALTPDTRLYIDSPLLVDLLTNNKGFWPKSILNKILDYRYGCSYTNLYKESELTYTNDDFKSAYSRVELANTGLLVTLGEQSEITNKRDWFQLDFTFKDNTYYLIKLDYEEINNCGEVYLSYGDQISNRIQDQEFMIVKGNADTKLKVQLESFAELPYSINLKHILIADLTGQQITESDVPNLPFI